MHLLLYTHTLLDAFGLSTGITVALLVGAAYGLLRLAYDVIAGIARAVARDQEHTRRIERIERELDRDDD